MTKRKWTSTEVAVVQMLADGLRTHEIAVKRGVSTRTVDNQINYLKLKVEAKTRIHLVIIALEEGVIGLRSKSFTGQPKPRRAQADHHPRHLPKVYSL